MREWEVRETAEVLCKSGAGVESNSGVREWGERVHVFMDSNQ